MSRLSRRRSAPPTGQTWPLSCLCWKAQAWLLVHVLKARPVLSIEEAFEHLLHTLPSPWPRLMGLWAYNRSPHEQARNRRQVHVEARAWRAIAMAFEGGPTLSPTWLPLHPAALQELWGFRYGHEGGFPSRAHAKLDFWHRRAQECSLHARHQPVWRTVFATRPLFLWPLALQHDFSRRVLLESSRIVSTQTPVSSMEAAAAVGVLCARWHAWVEVGEEAGFSRPRRDALLPAFERLGFAQRLDEDARRFCATTWAGIGSEWQGTPDPLLGAIALQACLREHFFGWSEAFDAAQVWLKQERKIPLPLDLQKAAPRPLGPHVGLALLNVCQDKWIEQALSTQGIDGEDARQAPSAPVALSLPALMEWTTQVADLGEQWRQTLATSRSTFRDGTLGEAVEQAWTQLNGMAQRFSLRLALLDTETSAASTDSGRATHSPQLASEPGPRRPRRL